LWTVDDPIYSTWNPIVTWHSGSFPNNNNNNNNDDDDDDNNNNKAATTKVQSCFINLCGLQ